MPFTIVSQPDPLTFCGNLPDFVLDSDTAVDFQLYQGADLILEERYWPDASGEIRVDLEEVIDGLLRVQVPPLDAQIFAQSEACKQFKAVFNTTEVLFTVIKGGVDAGITHANFLSAFFLTWQPQIKTVRPADPQWLTYYAAADCVLKAKGYLGDSTFQTVEIVALPAGQLSSVNVTWERLYSLFSGEAFSIDVWIDQVSIPVTYVQRYQPVNDYFEYADLFVFANSLGGVDSVLFTGLMEHNDNFKFQRALFDKVTRDYFVDPDQIFTKQTGYFRSENERRWSLEFFKSLEKFYYDNVSGDLKGIILPKQTLDSIPGDLNGYNFTFAYAKQTKYIQVERSQLAEIRMEHAPFYYGSSYLAAVTESDIKALPFASVLSGLQFDLPTGNNRYFTIALPRQFALDSVFDPEANEDLTGLFSSFVMLIDSQEYNVYKMSVAAPYSVSRNLRVILKSSGYTPAPLMIYYGPAATIPTTEAAVKALQSRPVSDLEFEMETGLNKTFIIATPDNLTLSRAYDDLAEENLKNEYSPVVMAINGKAYIVNIMQLAVPYSQNHIQSIKLTKNG